MAKLWILLRDKFFDNIIKIIGLILLFIAAVVLPYLSEPFKNFINNIPNILLIALALFLFISFFVLLAYTFFLKEEKQKLANHSEIVKEDKFKDWEFIDKYGIWKEGEKYYCPNCKTKDIISPLKPSEIGWLCLVKECKQFYKNEKYVKPKRRIKIGKRNSVTNW